MKKSVWSNIRFCYSWSLYTIKAIWNNRLIHLVILIAQMKYHCFCRARIWHLNTVYICITQITGMAKCHTENCFRLFLFKAQLPKNIHPVWPHKSCCCFFCITNSESAVWCTWTHNWGKCFHLEELLCIITSSEQSEDSIFYTLYANFM